MLKGDFLIGADEAGRGPLAGPVVVAAVMATAEALSKLPITKDSKQLLESERKYWYGKIRGEEAMGKIFCARAFASHTLIDKYGIDSAIQTALDKSLKNLPIDKNNHQVLLDGRLKAPKTYLRQQTIIRGDETEPIISLASIIAKVERDNFMIKIEKRYQGYGFSQHKGYATEDHYLALLKNGPCTIHRRSYLSFLEA